MTALWIIGTLIVAYLVGSIPFGLIAGKLVKGVDIRVLGSRNIGATNAARVIGWKWFPVVLLLDAAKGAGPCLAGHFLIQTARADLVLFAAIGALLGHFFSIYIGFKGGKGVATGLGVVLVITAAPWPLAALCALGVFALVLLATRYVGIASVVSAVSIPLFYYVWLGNAALIEPLMWRFVLLIVVALFVVIKHRGNIRRVIAGEEPRIGKKRETA